MSNYEDGLPTCLSCRLICLCLCWGFVGWIVALNQTEIIQSLSDALKWYKKELEWGVNSGELKHLTGRIGELYVAMITNGTMATNTNQRGYDVISSNNEQISVKTYTTSTQLKFNENTIQFVDRVIVLNLNDSDESGLSIEIVYDQLISKFLNDFPNCNYRTSGTMKKLIRPTEQLEIKHVAVFKDLEIVQFVSDTIRLKKDGNYLHVNVKERLRPIAKQLSINLFFQTGTEKNTRQLGADIIKQLNAT